MRCIRSILLGTLALALTSATALGEKRVALVIGNSGYQNVARLANPANDAAIMAATFKKAQFDVVESRTDLPAAAMRRVLRDFADQTRDADVAVIYYAGHGIEVDGNNYLIPVDAQLERDTDVYDETFALDRVLVAIEPARQLRLVILDACRDNPFAKTMKRTIGSRSVGRGLAKVEPSNPNTMIAFAAKAGFTASDGDGKNSPFAAALVKHLTSPGLDLRRAFGFVRDDVLKATANKQEPFVYGSLGGNDVALVPVAAAPVPAAAAPAVPSDPAAAIRRDYELALQVGTHEAWDFFIATYPDGFYAKLAQAQRNKLAAEEARLKATEKAKAAQDEQARLATEGAKAAEQAKAAAQVKAAEEIRVAAEKKKALEDTKVAEAEKIKAAAETKATTDGRIEAEKPKATASITSRTDQTAPETKSAATIAVADIPRLIETELRRVGCGSGAAADEWNSKAQTSLALFNKSAGTKLDVSTASLDTLNVVKSKSGRICPLVCEHGFEASGDRCVEIRCRPGFELGEDGKCKKVAREKGSKPNPEKRDEAAKPGAKPETKPENKLGSSTGSYEKSCRRLASGCAFIAATNKEACKEPARLARCLQTGIFVGPESGIRFPASKQ